VITGLQEQPATVLANAGIGDRPGQLLLRPDLNTALDELWRRNQPAAPPS
jgi:hypothetical protein